jgi:hypothetical protein
MRELYDDEHPPLFSAAEINRRIHGGEPMQSDLHE